jgi:hypothetical protein
MINNNNMNRFSQGKKVREMMERYIKKITITSERGEFLPLSVFYDPYDESLWIIAELKCKKRWWEFWK